MFRGNWAYINCSVGYLPTSRRLGYMFAVGGHSVGEMLREEQKINDVVISMKSGIDIRARTLQVITEIVVIHPE